MKKLFHAFAFALLGVFLASPASAEETAAKLEGTWWLSVDRSSSGLPPFVSLHTYTAKCGLDGTNTSGTAGPTHGNWVKTGHGRFTVTFWAFRLDAARQHVGYNLTTLNIRFTGPDEYVSVHQAQVFDLNWNRTELRYDNGAAHRLPIVPSPQQP
jgi:hypothetical protein